jgi:hypothetical protein
VRSDQELGLAVGQGPDRMGVPDFLEKRFRHGGKGENARSRLRGEGNCSRRLW